ncbi:hypothetical protein TIFTF001_021154 [Ficus carica]|uniref:Uncharacterized protein n=1 Tax=Ficus carica TaxID=3494 RepID=A0AA88A9Z1_FICCA|nr:hypothetical protein TIFTF001_021154 [Ficus carica]
MIWLPLMQISPAWFRGSDTPVLGSIIFTSAFLTTVPQAPDFTGNDSLANAKHIDTDPPSVMP